ncbi:MAG: protein-disulfide reductase DsbD family protein [Burkholderiales bacterium]|nr:protein-disulfide reductase DsbD family protein [Burkholderiales bacterium]MDW8468187.1 protein-disulfide reductase DsbD family protein [Burkholderiales bacterium]
MNPGSKARTFALAGIALAFAIAAILWRSLSDRAGVVRTEHAEAELVAAREAAEPGAALTVALRLKVAPGWHTYWRNPGDSGQPASLEWRLPPGFEAGPIRWPVPARFSLGPIANYGYKGEVLLPVEIRVPSDAKGKVRLAARAKWLVCDPDRCLPESGEVSLELPVGRGGPSRWARAFDAIELPRPAPERWKLSARREGERVLLEIAGAGDEPPLLFFPYEEGKVEHAAPQPVEPAADGLRLAIPASRQPVGEWRRLFGVLATAGGRGYEIDVPIEGK